ncbi:MAG: CoA transferase [Deltaproteobacteria bacterium]|nr:CoA transferase [Deltaproteobacteria bacterium]
MKGVLEGMRVLDLTQMLAGPFGSMLMGDLGGRGAFGGENKKHRKSNQNG